MSVISKTCISPAKVEDQQLRYFLQKNKITSFDAFKPERNLQKQYKTLIISRSKERLVCLFMTDNFSECSLSVIVKKKPHFVFLTNAHSETFWCCHANASSSTSLHHQVLRGTFDQVQTLQQKNVFLLVDEAQIRPTVSISGWLLSGMAENNRECKATSF
ncbi:hypothetical protein FHG87_022966 [Trinorchestia longiramus]|nr:hypothetical protein FHG87_022966 [Trinorchestia longiramus]